MNSQAPALIFGKRKIILLAWLFTFATLLGILLYIQYFLFYHYEVNNYTLVRPFVWHEVLLATLLTCYTWLPFVPLIWMATQRFRRFRSSLTRISGHCLLGLLIGFMHLFSMQTLRTILFSDPDFSNENAPDSALLNQMMYRLLFYAALAAVSNALIAGMMRIRKEKSRARLEDKIQNARWFLLQMRTGHESMIQMLEQLKQMMKLSAARTERVLNEIGAYLRMLLHAQSERIPLLDEIEILQLQFKLNRRLKLPNIQFTMDLDEKAGDFLVPNGILRYFTRLISGKTQPIEIRISAVRNSDQLLLKLHPAPNTVKESENIDSLSAVLLESVGVNHLKFQQDGSVTCTIRNSTLFDDDQLTGGNESDFRTKIKKGTVNAWLAVSALWLAISMLISLQEMFYFEPENIVSVPVVVVLYTALWTCFTMIIWKMTEYPRNWFYWIRHAACAIFIWSSMAGLYYVLYSLNYALVWWYTSYFTPTSIVQIIITYAMIISICMAIRSEQHAARMEIQSAQLRAQLSKARILSLEMQLQPHFLFNTLHVIGGLAHIDTEKAEQMLDRFIQLLRRANVNGSSSVITLAEELEIISDYIAIQNARFGKQLHVQISAEDEALKDMVPRLILQPLIENAIRHGAGLKRWGKISVSAYRNNGALMLEISDNGNGLSHDYELQEGLGLRLTRERIASLYGEHSTLEFQTSSIGGLCARLKIPRQTASI